MRDRRIWQGLTTTLLPRLSPATTLCRLHILGSRRSSAAQSLRRYHQMPPDAVSPRESRHATNAMSITIVMTATDKPNPMTVMNATNDPIDIR